MSNKITQLSTYDKVNEQWRQPVDLGAKAKNIDLDIGNGSIRNMQGVIGEYTDNEPIAQKIGHLDRTISYADWNLLTEEEKNSGDWYIPDFPVSGSIVPMASDFTGATGSIAGIHGLVPAPAAGDENKVLKGDGSWGEAAADDNFVGSTEQWNSLSLEQKLKHKTADIDDDFNGLPVDSELNPNSTNPIQNKVVAENIGSIGNNIEAIVNVYGSKNLLPDNAVTSVIDGITFTVNSDGSITANGTASAAVQPFMSIPSTLVGNYLFNGCPAGGGASLYDIYVWDSTTSQRARKWDGVTESDSDFGGSSCEIKLENGHNYRMVFRIRSGVTVNNIVFKPMIRDPRISNDTYVPYSMTNRELTENVTVINQQNILQSKYIRTGGSYSKVIITRENSYEPILVVLRKSSAYPSLLVIAGYDTGIGTDTASVSYSSDGLTVTITTGTWADGFLLCYNGFNVSVSYA